MEITIDEKSYEGNPYYEMNCSLAQAAFPGCGGHNCFRFSYSGGVVTNYWQGAGLAKSGQNLYAATSEAECLAKQLSLGLPPVDPERLVTEFVIDSGASKSFQLPTESGGTYDPLIWTKKASAKVYTGDPINFTAYDDPKTLLSFDDDDLYTVKMTKIFEGFRFNNGGDKTKIQDFLSFGALKPGNNGGNFYGCSNLTMDKVKDILNLIDNTTLTYAFKNSGVTNIPNIGLWWIKNITSFAETFNGITLAVDTYSDFLNNCLANTSQVFVPLDADGSKYNAGAAVARGILASAYFWIITDLGEDS